MPQKNVCPWDGDSNLTFRNPQNCWSLLVEFMSLVVEVGPLEVEFGLCWPIFFVSGNYIFMPLGVYSRLRNSDSAL